MYGLSGLAAAVVLLLACGVPPLAGHLGPSAGGGFPPILGHVAAVDHEAEERDRAGNAPRLKAG